MVAKAKIAGVMVAPSLVNAAINAIEYTVKGNKIIKQRPATLPNIMPAPLYPYVEMAYDAAIETNTSNTPRRMVPKSGRCNE